MFYGAAIGDALGVFAESMSPSQVRKHDLVYFIINILISEFGLAIRNPNRIKPIIYGPESDPKSAIQIADSVLLFFMTIVTLYSSCSCLIQPISAELPFYGPISLKISENSSFIQSRIPIFCFFSRRLQRDFHFCGYKNPVRTR